MTGLAPDWTQLAGAALAALDPAERETAILYLVRRMIPAGAPLPWPEGTGLRFDQAVALAFADLEPGVNWTHRARYLVLGSGGAVLDRIDTDRPPFLRGVPDDLYLVHLGENAPAWAAATGRRLDR
ncbi:hypothetical protein [Rhodovulum marinum]|uniref:Uncharacterized protein n=1 Tax=Rhodovulum marinum TaxID=320662 RepID=A0A4R2Q3U8_9RHOB|nr:hypothetical protein [Rhodovulum marinum]TCP43250.1 hypothetical protein EV662_102447 [Rhodovulum marinum]